LKETSFSKYIEVGARFGKKGKNSVGDYWFLLSLSFASSIQ
jgi:hypothetical protein